MLLDQLKCYTLWLSFSYIFQLSLFKAKAYFSERPQNFKIIQILKICCISWHIGNSMKRFQATRATILPRDSGVKDFRQCGTLLCHLVTFPKPPVPRRSLRSQAPQLCCCCCRGTRFMASSAGPAQHTTSKQWDWVRSHGGCRADVSKQEEELD